MNNPWLGPLQAKVDNAQKALEAWRRWWQDNNGSPAWGRWDCGFCYSTMPGEHDEDCPYLIVKQIAEEEGWTS